MFVVAGSIDLSDVDTFASETTRGNGRHLCDPPFIIDDVQRRLWVPELTAWKMSLRVWMVSGAGHSSKLEQDAAQGIEKR